MTTPVPVAGEPYGPPYSPLFASDTSNVTGNPAPPPDPTPERAEYDGSDRIPAPFGTEPYADSSRFLEVNGVTPPPDPLDEFPGEFYTRPRAGVLRDVVWKPQTWGVPPNSVIPVANQNPRRIAFKVWTDAGNAGPIFISAEQNVTGATPSGGSGSIGLQSGSNVVEIKSTRPVFAYNPHATLTCYLYTIQEIDAT